MCWCRPRALPAGPQTFPLTNSTSGKTLTIGEITADDAVLEFISEQPAQARFILRIDRLTLDQWAERPCHVSRPLQQH